jgi:signal transduction histidine kinase
MILLYARNETGTSNVLKVASSSDNLRPGDYQVAVPGLEGSIEEALRVQEPVLNHAPDADPELSRFESLRKCGTVLVLSLAAGNEMYGVMIIASNERDAFREMHVEMMRAVANQAAASLNNARLYGSLIDQRDRLVEIEKTTRSQLASDLHDGPTQGVAAITMRLNYIRKLIEKKPETAVDELYKIEDLARKTTKEIRHMLFELRPMALEQGLQEGLVQLAAKMQETYEQKVSLAFDTEADRLLDKRTVQTLFSIAAETVNNARKHAKADTILIQVGLRGDALTMEITDNGVGYDVEAALAAARGREGHLGLLNLQERALLVEGNLDLWSEQGKGSRTTVTIPLEVLRTRQAEEVERAAEGAA